MTMQSHLMTQARSRIASAIVLFALAVPGPAALVLVAQSSQPPARAAAPARPASLDEILKEISTFNGGIDSAAFWKLRDYVYARKDDAAGRAECEAKLLAFLKTPATPVAKMAACRHLRVIAGDTAVPALQAMLSDASSSDMALYALQQIPGPVAGKALVQSLSTTTGQMKTAVVAALGRRGNADAVAALAPLLKQPAFAAPAAVALGEIGGDAAVQALGDACASAPADLKPAVAAALMKCAEKLLAAKNAPAALRVYDTLWSDASLPVPIRRGAAMGRISAAGSGAAALVTEMLRGSDPVAREAAIAEIKNVFAADAIGPVCARMAGLPDNEQVQLLAVLSGYPKEWVLPAILQAGHSGAAPVRMAAMKALESVGDQTVVAFLADAAAKARGPEQNAARSALGMLKGRAVDEAIVAQLDRRPPEGVERELLLAVADRRIFAAKRSVTASLASPSVGTRVQALKTLRAIGTPSDIPTVLDALLKTDDESERTEAEATTAALARKIVNGEDQSNVVKARLTAEKDPAARARIIGALEQIGDSSALPLVRAALDDGNPVVFDAGVRALAGWPTSAARDDAFQLARDSRDETHRLLAIRGFVRMVTLDQYRDPETAVADLRSAAAFSWRPEEQKLVLSALVKFPCQDGVDLATGFLREPSLKDEAQAAIEKIGKAMKSRQR